MKKFFGFKYCYSSLFILLLLLIIIIIASIIFDNSQDIYITILFYAIMSLMFIFELLYTLHSLQWVLIDNDNIILRSALGLKVILKYEKIKSVKVEELTTFSTNLGMKKYEKWIIIITDKNEKPKNILNRKASPYMIPYESSIFDFLNNKILKNKKTKE